MITSKFFVTRNAGPRAPEGKNRIASSFTLVVGSALAARNAKLVDARDTGRWGRPLAQALMEELRAADVSLVALPRPPRSLPAAVALGRAAQREVGAQLFASRALRELSPSVGEPVSAISAHLADDAPGGGVLRRSVSVGALACHYLIRFRFLACLLVFLPLLGKEGEQ